MKRQKMWRSAITLALAIGVFGSAQIASAQEAKPTKLTGTVIGTAGSYQDGGNDRAKAFDGDTSTFFDAPEDTNGNGVWVGIDLGEGKDAQVTKIRYYPRSEFAGRMLNGKFQGSNTADFSKDVVDLFTVTEEPGADQWSEGAKINSEQKFRYLRFLSPDEGWGNVGEIEFLTK